MLNVTIYYKELNPMNVTINGYVLRHSTDQLQIKFNHIHALNIVHHPKEGCWILSFPPELNLVEFEKIHELIEQLLLHCREPKLDDQRAFIGYLPDGGKAFIYNQFIQWREFILKAKHRSMEGQKVEIFNGDEKLADGILVDYVLDDEKAFQIKSITLLTRFGEKVFTHNNMSIAATGEFF
ncbi:hypothetical protein [Alkalihalobacterium elongatum]|uniref:hypothetical protein n=1 Tax=Alkalihalobacterium elongatum TaxID=2675466 RepID=UPI001C2006A9|nr:hypothetical protein [Alkalihalobacterium elongatum]